MGDITKDSEIYINSAINYLTNAGKNQSRFIEKGTFILSNSGATLGVPKILNLSGCINDGIVAIQRLDSELISKYFLYYYFASQTNRLRDELNQGATQPNLNTDLVKQLPVPLPNINEQKLIVDFIQVQNEKINKAINNAQESILKLIEYKTTLIDHAVIGKIKVS